MTVSAAYYHRQYRNDIDLQYTMTKRVALVVLPFISLYRPLGIVLSVGLGASRAVTHIQNIFLKGDKYTAYQLLTNIGLVCLAVISVANASFQHYLVMIATTVGDLLSNISHIYEFFMQGRYDLALSEIGQFFNSTIYLATLINPCVEIILLSLLLQIMVEAYHSRQEFQKGRYLEGCGKALMGGVRSYQASFYAQKCYEIHQEKICNFIDNQRKKVTSIFHQTAGCLAKPFWWYSEKAVRVFSPIRPGQCQQCATKVTEIAARCFYAAIGIPLIPIFISLWGLELIPRFLAKITATEPYTHLRGDVEEKTLPADGKITILSMNVCFAPGGFTWLFGGVAPWRERVDKLVQLVKEKNPDVVCLQEVNEENAQQALWGGLKDLYAYGYFPNRTITTQNNKPGVLSKYPIDEYEVKNYRTYSSGSQLFVDKGYIHFFLTSAGQRIASVFSTHLSPSKNDLQATESEQQVRKQQLEQLIERMEETKSSHYPTILAGDMNLPWNTAEHQSSVLKTHFHDPRNQGRTSVSPQESTCLTDYMVQKYKNPSRQLSQEDHAMIVDYMLLHKDPSSTYDSSNMSVQLVRAINHGNILESLSDHNGLLAEVDVRA